MKLIVCIDDRGGMLFNKRRVSSDRVVTEKIAELCKEETLFVSPYSYPLFTPSDSIVCSDDPLSAAVNGWCFVEDGDVSGVLPQTEKIVIFHWNRTYPADLHFPVELVRKNWQLEHCEEFPGYSHQRITMEVYRR